MPQTQILTSSLLSYGIEEWATQDFIASVKVVLRVFNVREGGYEGDRCNDKVARKCDGDDNLQLKWLLLKKQIAKP